MKNHTSKPGQKKNEQPIISHTPNVKYSTAFHGFRPIANHCHDWSVGTSANRWIDLVRPSVASKKSADRARSWSVVKCNATSSCGVKASQWDPTALTRIVVRVAGRGERQTEARDDDADGVEGRIVRRRRPSEAVMWHWYDACATVPRTKSRRSVFFPRRVTDRRWGLANPKSQTSTRLVSLVYV